MRTTSYLLQLLSFFLLLVVPTSASAQEREPLFDRDDALWSAAFTLGTLALAPLDRHVAERLQHPGSQENRFLQHAATGFRILGHPGALGIAGSLYAVGRLTESESTADIGLHAGTAILVGAAATYAGKAIAGRARPIREPDNPFNFGLLRGISDDHYRSFPSGHTVAAFALASAITSETAERWPDNRWWVGTALFSAATMTGASRMYNNLHWASDVVMGAGIGTFAGWKVVQYTHERPGNELDGVFLSVTIRPGGGWSLGVVPAPR